METSDRRAAGMATGMDMATAGMEDMAVTAIIPIMESLRILENEKIPQAA